MILRLPSAWIPLNRLVQMYRRAECVLTASILSVHGEAIVRCGQEKEPDSTSEPMRDRSIRREGAKTIKEKTGKNNMSTRKKRYLSDVRRKVSSVY